MPQLDCAVAAGSRQAPPTAEQVDVTRPRDVEAMAIPALEAAPCSGQVKAANRASQQSKAAPRQRRKRCHRGGADRAQTAKCGAALPRRASPGRNALISAPYVTGWSIIETTLAFERPQLPPGVSREHAQGRFSKSISPEELASCQSSKCVRLFQHTPALRPTRWRAPGRRRRRQISLKKRCWREPCTSEKYLSRAVTVGCLRCVEIGGAPDQTARWRAWPVLRRGARDGARCAIDLFNTPIFERQEDAADNFATMPLFGKSAMGVTPSAVGSTVERRSVVTLLPVFSHSGVLQPGQQYRPCDGEDNGAEEQPDDSIGYGPADDADHDHRHRRGQPTRHQKGFEDVI